MGRSGRYELKYVIEEARAQAIADFVRSYLDPSPHNGAGPVPGHPVISLYLDSPDLFLFHQGFAGHRNRMKLRIRFYDGQWEHPAFLEIKRRVGDVICKDRAMISREGVRQMLGDWPHQPYWPDPSVLAHGKRRADVQADFYGLCNTIRARGVLYVSYVREIFESHDDDELRVTFDRQVRGTLHDGTPRLTLPTHGVRPSPYDPYYIPPDGIIMEMKFNHRAPQWMYTMARLFNLQRRAVCKYCALVSAMGLQWGRRPLAEEQEAMVL